jgi:protein MpaA
VRGVSTQIARWAVVASVGLWSAVPSPGTAAPVPSRQAEVIGHSVLGRAIRAVRIGPASATRRLLIVACIHGDEPAGEAITRRLRFASPPADTAIWVIDRANPDGCAAGTRKNARGVDLNRNSPWHWAHITGPGGVFYSGPRPWSEPESRALDAFVKRIRPAITIWYHQHANLVDASIGGDVRIERDYARRVGMRLVHLGLYRGSFTGWQNTNLPGSTAFVVELPAGALPAVAVNRHVAAVLALARITSTA